MYHGGFTALEMLVDREDLAPSEASCSRNSDQSPASDSFRPLVSWKLSADNEGVLGVRCQGEIGVRKLGFEAPGRASPACSRCSAVISITCTRWGRESQAYRQSSLEERQ